MKNKSRAEEMAQLLEEQASSGMSKKAFCEARGLAPSMFYYWQRRLSGEQAKHEQEPGFMLYYKQLERGTFEVPGAAAQSGGRELEWHDLAVLLQGIELESTVRQHK